jgi:hypothetical protein
MSGPPLQLHHPRRLTTISLMTIASPVRNHTFSLFVYGAFDTHRALKAPPLARGGRETAFLIYGQWFLVLVFLSSWRSVFWPR